MRYYSLVVFFSLVLSVFASSGDRSDEFQLLVKHCELQKCRRSTFSPPLSLRLTGWTCLDDCKYTSMHAITDREVLGNIPVQQYYGKWPFYRFAGMQEPASVAFSLMNLWFHVQGLQ